MSMKALTILGLFGIGACVMGCSVSYGNVYEVRIDPAFTAGETALVLESLDNWEHAIESVRGDGYLTFHVTVGTCNDDWHEICVVPSTRAILDAMGAGPTNLGYTLHNETFDRGTSYLAVDKLHYAPNADGTPADINVAAFTTCTMHEIGHAMGLAHEANGNVMSAKYPNASHQLTCLDVSQYLGLRGMGFADCGKL
jgi:hypothetical protein